MLMLDNWEQSAVFDPTNPTQKKIEKYAGIPGAYASFYFNKVPVRGSLQGPFSSAFATGAGVFLGILAASVAVSGGAWALRKAGVIKKPAAGVSGLGFFKFKRTRKLFRKLRRR